MKQNNLAALKKIKADIGRKSQERFITQEETALIISNSAGVSLRDVERVIKAQQKMTVERLKAGQDVLLPGIMRIEPGEGGLTRRYIKIKSISRYLMERLK